MMRPVLLLVLGALAACRTMPGGADVPALIDNPDDGSRAALQDAVRKATGTNVLLADDALTTESTLSIERRQPASIEGRPATGRNMEPATLFRLVLSGAECILIDERDGSRFVLENTTCIPLE